MKENRIFISQFHTSSNELKYVKNALHRNEMSNYGNNVNGFEVDLESYLGQHSKITCLSSGTAALHLALILAGVNSEDEVICQSMTFSASANPIVYLGANPIFVDSEIDTWNMCPEFLVEAINDRIYKGKKPKAIIVVHLYGMPAKMDEICAIAKKYNIALIEDAAEALGSTYKGQKCGTFGDFSILSFNGNKIISTSGGGALVTNSEEQKNKAIFLATQARDNAIHYQHSEIGYNYRMSNILAGIGRAQMEVLNKHVELRRANNTFYREIFKDIKGVSVFKEPSEDYFSNHWLSCIVINHKKALISSEELRIKIEAKNIESRPLWKPMHLQPVFKNTPFYGNGISQKLFETGLCLPSGSNLSENDFERILNTINSSF